MEKEQMRREQGKKAEEEMVACKIDATNAFNSDSHASVMGALVQEPSLQNLAWSTACQLAPCYRLENRGGNRARGRR